MRIVFLGNCQVAALAAIIQRFVSPYVDIETDFVDAHHHIGAASFERLNQADIAVVQVSQGASQLGADHVKPGIPVHVVPAVSGAFLYPHHGVPHPANPVEQAGTSPFQPEFNDRFLAKLYTAQVEPHEALRRYRACNVATQTSVGRIYDLTIAWQRKLDAMTGYACADVIESYLCDEQLFQSAYHFSGRIARHIAGQLCDRLGFDPKYGQRIRDHLRDAPFVRLFVPVHPSIAQYFGLQWVNDATSYPYRFEGSFTFDEYVIRFMQVRWSEAMQAGVLAARNGSPGAKALLEKGLQEAPRSAEGPHALSMIREQEGDLDGAIALQRQAVAAALDADIPFRLGTLLLRIGDIGGAEAALRHAIELDPVGYQNWSALSQILHKAGKVEAARSAARRAALYAPEVPPRAAATPDRAAQPKAQATAQITGLYLEIVAHIQNQGDTASDLQGLAGTPGSTLAVEGFTILANPVTMACGITYQAVLSDMSLAAPVRLGAYCGTRGQNQPIYGLRVCADPGSGDLAYEAWFVDGEHIGPVETGMACKATSRAPLTALRIMLAGHG